MVPYAVFYHVHPIVNDCPHITGIAGQLYWVAAYQPRL